MILRQIVTVLTSALLIRINQGQIECKTQVNLTCGPNSSDRGIASGIETRIVTGKQFTCDGTLVGWRVAGTVGQGRQYPKLQVWRLRNTSSSSQQYFKPGNDISMEGTVSSPPVNCDIFEHTLDEASQVTVQSGDILGIELPPENDQAFDILYALGGGPLTYIYRRRLNNEVELTDGLFGCFSVQPLIELRVIPAEITTEPDIPTVSITSNHPATTTDSTQSITTTSSKVWKTTTANDDKRHPPKKSVYISSFIAVAAMGGVTEISILTTVIILLAVLVIKTHQRRAHHKPPQISVNMSDDEPAYHQILF